jgi:sugar transferase EpsL
MNTFMKKRSKHNIYSAAIKRLFDIAISMLLMLVLSPALLFVSAVLFTMQGAPVLFRQDRPGHNGNLFVIYKFRTMRGVATASPGMISDENRLTALGKLLRRTSLDELPELINVLRGDMSLVGPRPLLVEYLPLYTNEQARRHEVRPGITGWAQVHGRNAISWEDKFKLDVWYVDNRSFILDLKILLLTFVKVLKREGINQEGQATMKKFRGTGAVHE